MSTYCFSEVGRGVRTGTSEVDVQHRNRDGILELHSHLINVWHIYLHLVVLRQMQENMPYIDPIGFSLIFFAAFYRCRCPSEDAVFFQAAAVTIPLQHVTVYCLIFGHGVTFLC